MNSNNTFTIVQEPVYY